MTLNKSIWGLVIKIILIAIAAICLLSLGVSWYINAKLKSQISSALKEIVYNSTNKLYTLDFEDVKVSLLTGNVSIQEVEIKANLGRYKELVEEQLAPDNVYTVKLKRLELKSFHPWKLFNKKMLHVDELIFNKPSVEMQNKFYSFNQDRPPIPRISPYQFISKHISELFIGEIKFQDVDFKYVDLNGARPLIDSVSGLNIRCVDYLVDQNSASDTSRIYLFKEINLSVKNYSFTTADLFYKASIKDLKFSTNGGNLEIKEFKLTPRYKEINFAERAGYARDRFDVTVGRIHLEGLNLPNYIKNQEVYAKNMRIEGGVLNVYSDSNFEKKTRNSLGRFPHQLLQKLPHYLTIEKTVLEDAQIKYAELDSESNLKGEIEFSQVNAEFDNITNHPKVKARNEWMSVKTQSYLMGDGKLDATFNFNLNDPSGKFNYKGTLGKFTGKNLNRITKAMGMVQIKGDVKELNFSVQANDAIAVGNLIFKYKGLSVKILEVDEDKNKLVRKGWASFLANNLILDSDNPMPGRAVRVASLKYERNAEASFFSYIWRTLFSGIKYSVGITPQKEASIQQHINNFEGRKEDREVRKGVREKRQEERKQRKGGT